MLHELDTVIVRTLLALQREVIGTPSLARQPRVGDMGTVVQVYPSGEVSVENVDQSGATIWLADFSEDELATLPCGWDFDVSEVSAGVFCARGRGPGGVSVVVKDTVPNVALSKCFEFAFRGTKG